MSMKETLMLEAKNIETSVELDSIFESAELSADTRAKFATVFESVVKAKAVELAESHIEAIADKAELQVEELAEAKIADLTETVNKYFDHLVENWMEDNKLAVESGIKANMFDSLLESMKETFIDHNITVPAESVDIVAEMEEEIAEAQTELNSLVEANMDLKSTIKGMKREQAITEATLELTDVAKSKVLTLAEGMSFEDGFETKLAAIVEMVSAVKPAQEQPVNESNHEVVEIVLESEDDKTGLNFEDDEQTGPEEVIQESAKFVDPEVAQYLK